MVVILCPTDFPPPSVINSLGKPYRINNPKGKLITTSSVALGKSNVSTHFVTSFVAIKM